MLINLNVFPLLKKPWFPIIWKEATKTTPASFQGEDWGFCERLEAAHIPIFVDQELSWEIEHLGVYSYGHELVEFGLMADEFENKLRI